MWKITDGVMLGLLCLCGFSDYKSKEIPVSTMVLFTISTILLTAWKGATGLGLIAGGVIIGLFFWGISKVTKEAIGYGDSWVITLLGVYLGGVKLLWLLFVASLCASICSLFYLWRRNWKRSSTLPFVPFLVVGYLGVMFL